MRLLRIAFRVPLLMVVTVLHFGVFLTGDLILSGHPGRAARWRYRLFRSWARWIARVIGMRMEVEGPPPEPPFYLVCNHLSYVDVFLLGGQLDCVFVAKADIEHWPFVNRLCRSVGTIFIDRQMRRDVVRVNRLIKAVLAYSGIVIFPEATSTEGRELLPFKPSLLQPAVDLDLPVHCAALCYQTPPSQPPAHEVVCWWGDMAFPQHVWRLLGISGFKARLRFSEGTVRSGDRKALAHDLRQAMLQIFAPTAPPEEEREEGS